MFGPFGALLVVEGADAGRGVQRGERLGVERVDEPVVVHEPGGDLPLPGGLVIGLVAAYLRRALPSR